MKKTIAGMICMLLVLGLVGCGSPENNSSTAGESLNSSAGESSSEESSVKESEGSEGEAEKDYGDVEFRIAWWGGDARNTQTVEIIENFEKKYPNLKIDVEYATFGDHFTSLTTQATAGNLPDVYMMDYSRINEFVDAGQMEQLDSYIADGRINLSDVEDSLVAGGIVNGNMYAIATGTNAPSGFYDPEVLKDLNLSLSQAPTWGELSNVITEVYEKTGKCAYISPNKSSLQIYLRSIGKDLYAQDGKGYGFEPEDMVAFLEYFYDLYESGAAVNEATYEGEDETVLREGTGNWMKLYERFSNLLMSEEEGAGKRLAMFTYPSADNAAISGTYLKPVMLWGISPTSKNKDLAAAFINYFVNDPYVYEVCGTDRGIPISKAMREQLAPSMSESEAYAMEFVSYLADGVATAISPAAPTGSEEAISYLNELIERLKYKQFKREELLDAVKAAMEQGTAILEQAGAGE